MFSAVCFLSFAFIFSCKFEKAFISNSPLLQPLSPSTTSYLNNSLGNKLLPTARSAFHSDMKYCMHDEKCRNINCSANVCNTFRMLVYGVSLQVKAPTGWVPICRRLKPPNFHLSSPETTLKLPEIYYQFRKVIKYDQSWHPIHNSPLFCWPDFYLCSCIFPGMTANIVHVWMLHFFGACF